MSNPPRFHIALNAKIGQLLTWDVIDRLDSGLVARFDDAADARDLATRLNQFARNHTNGNQAEDDDAPTPA